MRIIKKYWLWDESYNTTDFKLGLDIEPFVKQELISSDPEESNCYLGKDGFPWKITSINGRVKGVAFSRSFFPLFDKRLWDMEANEFETVVNHYLTPADGSETGDLLYVVFREFFVAIAMIYRKSS